jgi:hypothetical protein
LTGFDCFNDNSFESFSEFNKFLVVIKFTSIFETLGPCVHGSNGVSGSFLSLLMESVMSSNGTVSSFRFNGAVWALKDRGHKTKRSITLSNDIRLNITIVVFTGPKESTVGFDCVSNHVIDKSMFIPKTGSIELCFVFFIKNLLEDIFESSIVFLHDSILGCQVAWVDSCKRIFEAFMCKSYD